MSRSRGWRTASRRPSPIPPAVASAPSPAGGAPPRIPAAAPPTPAAGAGPPPASRTTGARRSATAAVTGATTAAGTSCATATSPAVTVPPRWYANTSMAIHTAYSVRIKSRYAASTRSSARLPASEPKARSRRPPESPPIGPSQISLGSEQLPGPGPGRAHRGHDGERVGGEQGAGRERRDEPDLHHRDRHHSEADGERVPDGPPGRDAQRDPGRDRDDRDGGGLPEHDRRQLAPDHAEGHQQPALGAPPRHADDQQVGQRGQAAHGYDAAEQQGEGGRLAEVHQHRGHGGQGHV